MRKLVHSLKFKILMIVTGIVLTGILLETVIWIQGSIRQTEKTIAESVYSAIKVSNQNFKNTIQDIDRICALVVSNSNSTRYVSNYLRVMSDGSGASDREKVEAGREVAQYLVQLCNFKYYVNGMVIYTLNGHQQTFGIAMGEKELLKQEWMQEFLADDAEVRIIPPHKSLPDNKTYTTQVFSIIRKIMRGNDIKGIVLADINYQILEDYYSFDEFSGHQLAICSGEENDLLFPADKNNWKETLSSISLSADEERDYRKIRISKEDYMLLDTRMPVTDWEIYSLISYRSIVSASVEALKKTLFITAIIMVCVCMAVFLAIHEMTKGLSQLAKSVHEISNQNLELGIVIDSRDEVGELYVQINKMLKRIEGLIREIYHSENEKRELEIVALQEQINPHFLYNTLNIISYLAQLQGRKNIGMVSGALSDMLHVALGPEKYISVRQEIDYLKKYLGIMEYKYSGKFVSEFQVDDDAYSCIIPKLILQPLVENSLNHGIATMTSLGVIEIAIHVEQDDLYMTIRDNGKGMPAELAENINNGVSGETESRNRIGIYNVRDRIALIYGIQSEFRVLSTEGQYTLVVIRIPARKIQE